MVHQAVPSILRADGLSMVRIQPDDDQRGLPSAANVRMRAIIPFRGVSR